MKSYLFFISLLLFPACLFSQDMNYARKVLDTLTSQYFHGRGYTMNGDRKAAGYIAGELKSLGVDCFKAGYFQYFQIAINTFPLAVDVKIDQLPLKPGYDYLVGPSSCKSKGTFTIVRLDKDIINNKDSLDAFLKKDHSRAYILADTAGVPNEDYRKQIDALLKLNLVGAKGYIVPVQKLVYGTSQEVKNFAIIKVLRTALPAGATEISVNIRNKFFKNYDTQNVIGFLSGETDTFIVFTAHYDHLGTMGKDTYFPGANDNASGVSMVLNLAKYYASLQSKPHYSVAFILFTGEDVHLLGSKYYTDNPVFPLSQIKFLFNLDLVGTGDDGIKVVNGAVLKNEFDLMVQINNEKNYVKEVNPRGEAANSDHYYFYAKGVKSVFIYTLGGVSEYHNVLDKSSTLPLTKYESLFRLITDFVERYR